VNAPFRPAWWCRNPHLQTILFNSLLPRPRIDLRRERLELPDGDFVDLDWTPGTTGPIVVLLHGLQGSSDAYYARALMRAVDRAGWRGVVLHFRGCSGVPNRLPRTYHSGETGDFNYLVGRLRERERVTPLAAVGVSLGANVLLKWLGEQGRSAPLTAAVGISPPFLLNCVADRLNSGFSKLYQWHLTRALRNAFKQKRFAVDVPLGIQRLPQFMSAREFDTYVTAPLHGFRDAEHYYAATSCRQYLKGIAVPTLLIHSRDDPFMVPDAIPGPQELADSITLELCRHGGHVGFVSGNWPWRARCYLEERVPGYLSTYLSHARVVPEHTKVRARRLEPETTAKESPEKRPGTHSIRVVPGSKTTSRQRGAPLP